MSSPRERLVGLIPAAGRGTRAYPYTATIPKSMLDVDGTPLVVRNVTLLRDQLGIREIVVVVGYRGEVIREALGDGDALGVAVTYVTNPRIELNLPYSVLLGGRELVRRGLGDRRCCVVLADECYVGSNHAELEASLDPDALVTCGLIGDQLPKAIRKNYVATIVGERIVGLEEKPQRVRGDVMGTGTWVLHADVFRRLEAAFVTGPDHGPREWTGWLGALAAGGALVRPFLLRGQYVNVNSRDDLNVANRLVRGPAAGRRTSLVYVIDQDVVAARGVAAFAAQESIDEIVVVRRAGAALSAPASTGKVRVVVLPDAAEVGELLVAGLDAATGDVLVLGYSDDTFAPSDVAKLLVYLGDADMVVGTRTTRQMIEQGSNMRGIVRAAHVTLAKLVEFCWWSFECRFTDVCCAYRALWRSTWESMRSRLDSRGAEVFPELLIEVLRARRRVIEIPVTYTNRDPDEPFVRSRYQSVGTFARVLRLILGKRIGDSIVGRAARALRRTWAPAPPRDRDHDRRLERRWQDEVGHELLEEPHATPGAAVVTTRQFDRIAAALEQAPDGIVVEVGCGRGHLLERLRAVAPRHAGRLVGLELSRAVEAVRGRGLPAVQGDGEHLPLRDGSVAAVIYFGALHHIIDYRAALRDAVRVLMPGGVLVVHEPVSSAFSRLVHRLLDPIIFRHCVYESPIDIHYKHAFREEVVADELRAAGLASTRERSDFLAYPVTGCYAGSRIARSERTMRRLVAVEQRVAAMPGLGSVGRRLAWRFTLVARKAGGSA